MKMTFTLGDEFRKPPRTLWLAKFLFPKAMAWLELHSFLKGKNK